MMTAESQRQTRIEAQRAIRVFGVVLLAIGALAAVNTVLVHASREHRYETGRELFLRAQALRAAGRNGEALEAFRSAYNRDPGNLDYHLGFVRALRSAGRVREARNSLEDLLRRQPADGAANTEMARVLAAEGQWRDGVWYYHRALYGQWPRITDLRALRFELADVLAAQGARQELLAELLLLGEPENGPAEAKHIGNLLLAAGDWVRAHDLFRAQLERDNADPELWAGLGRAQLGSGMYVAAERSLRRAGDSTKVRRDLDLVTRVNALDPTLRRLGAREKHRRAHELATRLAAALDACAGEEAVKAPAEHRPLAESTESDLDFVDELWSSRQRICPSGLQVPEELALVAGEVSK